MNIYYNYIYFYEMWCEKYLVRSRTWGVWVATAGTKIEQKHQMKIISKKQVRTFLRMAPLARENLVLTKLTRSCDLRWKSTTHQWENVEKMRRAKSKNKKPGLTVRTKRGGFERARFRNSPDISFLRDIHSCGSYRVTGSGGPFSFFF